LDAAVGEHVDQKLDPPRPREPADIARARSFGPEGVPEHPRTSSQA
jgi:hypothetical protein